MRSELMPPWLDPERALHIVGDWHGHVVAGSYLPSDQDLNSWASNLWKGRASEFVSLILSHGSVVAPFVYTLF